MTESPAQAVREGQHSGAEHLPPAFPERAAWGTAGRLRAWQAEALERYLASGARDFLVAATPGAGKTAFALRVAAELRSRGTVDRIIVVTPTEHLKTQWADAAARAGLRLDPRFRNDAGAIGRGYHGVAVTYAQVAAKASLHQALTGSARTLVVLDEVHHGGDALSWGDAIRDAFGPAVRRLSLTGTPFRSDDAPIPFVEYVPRADGTRISLTDYSYGYARALADGVVRPVLFFVYAGRMRWRTRAGEEFEAVLGQDDTRDVTAQAWRTALDPAGEWIPSVFRAADRRLSEVRQSVPDAGGLVIATDRSSARAYARILEQISGEAPTVVLSDDSGASERIAAFAASSARWIIAVRMVSEGVDVPRLAVGVYATNASTPLFFAQAIGRFVRARRRGETATVFLPEVPVLTRLAAELEAQRDHVLGRPSDEQELWLDDGLLEAAQRQESASAALADAGGFAALSSDASFGRTVYAGADFGGYAEVGSDEELDFLGLPGILEPAQIREVLLARQARQARRSAAREGREAGAAERSAPAQPLYRTLAEQRRLLNDLVAIVARQSGRPHGSVHNELRRACGGPEVARATSEQLQARIGLARRWISHG